MNASNPPAASIDPVQAALFGGLANDWWDPKGSSALLHKINPARLAYIRAHALDQFGRDPGIRSPFAGLAALDVGCGGGLVTEPLARMGFCVSGLDAAEENIAVGRAHAEAMGLAIDYHAGSAESLAATGVTFDLVTCLEVIEHVADLDSFLIALRSLLAPGGLLIFSTPNRTALSRLVLITGAENILRVIPKGAHDWSKFLTPDELRQAMVRAGLEVTHTTGLGYRPGQGFALSDDMRVNYIGCAIAG